MPFRFRVITPERQVYDQEVYEVLMPTTDGEVGVLAHHLPYLTSLKAGVVEVKIDRTDREFELLAISPGIASFYDNVLTLLVETAEHSREINLELAQAARDRAAKLKAEADRRDNIKIVALTAKLEKELARIKVAQMRRARRV